MSTYDTTDEDDDDNSDDDKELDLQEYISLSFWEIAESQSDI